MLDPEPPYITTKNGTWHDVHSCERVHIDDQIGDPGVQPQLKAVKH